MFIVETRQIPEQQVASIERRVLVAELPHFINDAMSTIYDLLGLSGAVEGTPFVVYHGEVINDSAGPVEACVPYLGEVNASGEVRLRLESAHKEAFTRITKAQVAFPEILEAYQAVEKWIVGQGGAACGPPREVYFTDWEAADDDDPACDIAFPIEM